MKRLSLEELKAQGNGLVKQNLEAIKGGNLAACHDAHGDGANVLKQVPGTHHN